MVSIDKNDVDISRLFSWKKKIDITNKQGTVLFSAYMRVIGDEDLNKAKVFALRKSAELRKKLREDNTDERLAFIPDKDLVEKDALVEQTLTYKIRDISSKAYNEIKFNISKEPDSRTGIEEQEKYQEYLDNFPENREKEIRNYIQKNLDRERERLNSLDLDTLFKDYEKELINQLCESEMIIRFREMCTYFGTYEDENLKERLFKKFDDFSNLQTDFKDQFISHYLALELDGENLKNLPEVTQ